MAPPGSARLPALPCSSTGLWRSGGPGRGVLQRATPPHQRLRASALSRAPRIRTGSVTLRRWLRRLPLLLFSKEAPGSASSGFLPRPPSGCRLLAAKEKVSASGSVSSHQSRQRPLCLLSEFPSPSGARWLPWVWHKIRRGFPTTLHASTPSPQARNTHSHTQAHSSPLSRKGTHRHIKSHTSLNSPKEQYVKKPLLTRLVLYLDFSFIL